MEDTRFDRLARSLSALRSRRAATALLGGLIAAPTLLPGEVPARKKKGKGKKKPKKCKPEAATKTCSGNCGSITNNCKKSVDCGPCTPPCTGLQPTADLQIAINDASPGSTLTLCAGTWAVTNTLHINKSLTLIGAGIDQSILDGGGKVRVLIISGTSTVTLQDLAITRGNIAPTVLATDIYGGGIHMTNATVTLHGVAVTNNTAGYGGGILHNSGALVLAAGTRVTGNKAVAGRSGAVGPGGEGGGIFSPGQGSITLESGSSVTGNSAIYESDPGLARGGGIARRSASLTLNPGSTVTGNTPDNCFPDNGACI